MVEGEDKEEDELESMRGEVENIDLEARKNSAVCMGLHAPHASPRIRK